MRKKKRHELNVMEMKHLWNLCDRDEDGYSEEGNFEVQRRMEEIFSD